MGIIADFYEREVVVGFGSNDAGFVRLVVELVLIGQFGGSGLVCLRLGDNLVFLRVKCDCSVLNWR